MMVAVVSLLQAVFALHLTTTPKGLPILQVGPVSLLLDSGSEELWVADGACSSCPNTLRVCPHLEHSSTILHYLKGEVKGQYSHMALGSIRTRFFCVREANNMGDIRAHGILGLKGAGTGKDFLRQYLAQNHFALYFGESQAQLLLTDYNKYGKELLTPCLGFKIQITSFSLNGIIIGGTHMAALDSGSEATLLPSPIYLLFKQALPHCSLSKKGFQCEEPITLLLQMSGGQSLRIPFPKTVPVFQSQECLFGIDLFHNYMVKFELSPQKVVLYQREETLLREERWNFKVGVLLYVMGVGGMAVLLASMAKAVRSLFEKRIII